MEDAPKKNIGWTFLTNHAHVLLWLAKSPGLRIRELAMAIGITERSIQRILADFAEEGYLSTLRQGRANTHVVDTIKPLEHPIESHRKTGDLIRLNHKDRAIAAKRQSMEANPPAPSSRGPESK